MYLLFNLLEACNRAYGNLKASKKMELDGPIEDVKRRKTITSRRDRVSCCPVVLRLHLFDHVNYQLPYVRDVGSEVVIAEKWFHYSQKQRQVYDLKLILQAWAIALLSSPDRWHT